MRKTNIQLDKRNFIFDIVSSPAFKKMLKESDDSNKYAMIQSLSALHSFIYSTTIAINTILLTVNSGLGLAIFVSNLKNSMEYSSFFITGFILSFLGLFFSAASAMASKLDTIKCIYNSNIKKENIYKNYTSQFKTFVLLSIFSMLFSIFIFVYGFFSIKESLEIFHI